MCCTIRRRRKKSFGTAIKKVGEDVSSELMKSINARVEAIKQSHLQPPMPSLTTSMLIEKLNHKINSMSTKSNDQLRQLQRIFGGSGVNKELSLNEFTKKIANYPLKV